MTKSRNILPPRRPWTDAELEVLRTRYQNEPTAPIAVALGRSLACAYNKAQQLGLAKSAEYLASPAACRLQRDGGPGVATRFKKGQVPANKGLRRPGWAPGRMRETQFKKGQMSGQAQHNWVPVGSTRVNADGYLDRKITDTGKPQKRWERVHRLVWIEAHGPIPEGSVVVFRPGRFTVDEKLITLDALEQITRVELMARNTYHQYPQPIPQLIQLRGALRRQINKRAKSENEDHRPA